MVADPSEVLDRFNAELPLVDSVARHVASTLGDFLALDDLLSAGREGLLEAARRYDPQRGAFRSFAIIRIQGAMFDCMRRMAALPRRAYQRVLALQADAIVNEQSRAFRVESGQTDSKEQVSERIATTTTVAALGLIIAAGNGAESEEAVDANPERALERAELFALVETELKKFRPQREADVIRLHYLHGMSLEAVAAELGIDRSWASRMRRQGIAKLAKRLRNA